MKIYPHLRSADAKEMRRQGERAFTMVEIAIAIGVIGFALVAIIGILPTGMNSQRDNREDTVIVQDAPYFLDAIKNGINVNNNINGVYQFTNTYVGQGLDFLTNYVESIRFNYYANGTIYASNTFYSSNLTGAAIIGLLSTPQTNYDWPYCSSNYFTAMATVRALSGPATLQQNGAKSGLSSFMAFTYQMEVMITPFNNIAPDSTNFGPYVGGPDPNQWITRSNRWLETMASLQPNIGTLKYNLFDVRMRFSWPVLPNGVVGQGRQTYRTMVSSQLLPTDVFIPATGNYIEGWFFQPKTFTNQAPAFL